MTLGPIFALALSMVAVPLAGGADTQTTSLPNSAKSGLAGATIVIMRHAEKPDDRRGGSGLSLAGRDRAGAYVDYFRRTSFGDAPLQITDLVAAADTSNSIRPRLTLTPLAKALNLSVQQPFKDDQVGALADWLANGPPYRTVLISWRHHMLPRLLLALSTDSALLLPEGNWPKGAFDWLIVLKYDAQGKIKSAERLIEPGMDALAGIAPDRQRR